MPLGNGKSGLQLYFIEISTKIKYYNYISIIMKVIVEQQWNYVNTTNVCSPDFKHGDNRHRNNTQSHNYQTNISPRNIKI